MHNQQALGDASPLQFDEDGRAEVDDDTGRLLLAMHRHVERAAPPRGEADPTCAGNDGDCSRDVAEPGAYCWQHAED